MSLILTQIQALVAKGEVIISELAYDRIAENDIKAEEIEAGAAQAVAVEEYPDFHKGPSVLALQTDRRGEPIHVVWGMRAGTSSPAVVVTAYRPDPMLWSEDFRRRR